MRAPSVQGAELTLAGEPFRVYGFNYIGGADRMGTLRFFARPTPRRHDQIARDMSTARRLGANSLRIYLELFAFIDGADGRPRREALVALERVLREAEAVGLLLDLTGNLVWRPGGAPRWYDELPAERRWAIQATFWTAVARVAAGSPAVLCYELTSEPWIGAEPRRSWYGGRFAGYDFGQVIHRNPAGTDPQALARRWIELLSRAIRDHDPDHPIGIGLLPAVAGSFSPVNVAGLLDLLLVHCYPTNQGVEAACRVIREFASHRRPVILGETFRLFADTAAQRQFLLRCAPHVSGYLAFFDGRSPGEVTIARPADRIYQAGLAQVLDLRPRLLGRPGRRQPAQA